MHCACFGITYIPVHYSGEIAYTVHCMPVIILSGGGGGGGGFIFENFFLTVLPVWHAHGINSFDKPISSVGKVDGADPTRMNIIIK